MFEDHWYQHPPPSPAEAPKLRRQESVKNQSPARGSLERTSSSSRNKVPEKKPPPEPPKADVPQRSKSSSDLISLACGEFILSKVDGEKAENGHTETAIGKVPARSKSHSDLEGLRIARYGRGRGTKGKARSNKPKIKDLRDIEDELDFADWYGEFEDELEDANNDEYRLFHSTLLSHLTTCDSLLSTTDSTISILDSLKSSFITVDSQTSAFQESCSTLLAQQSSLQTLADNVAQSLYPFTQLEPITRLLSRPGSDFVKTSSFRDMLSTLDYCLTWMENPDHKSFRDVESYVPRFRQCMTRALTLVRNYFVASVKEVQNEVVGRIKERQMNDTTQSALLYAKFRVNAPILKELVREIETRCGHEEYISLLNECYSCFSSVRQKLVVPIISKKMNELSAAGNAKTSKDLVSFARSAISFARSVASDEFELFYTYFSEPRGDGEVYNFLETICEPLYDHLRPKIIHETQLVKLCELCTLLQTGYMRDPEDPDIDTFDRSQLDFGQLIQSTFQDTQTRIVFRAQTVIRDEIEGFSPKPEDLDYPAKNARAPPPGPTENGGIPKPGTPGTPGTPMPKAPVIIDHEDGSFDTEAVFKGWYPTLRKSIWLLSRIYRLVNSTVFDDLAHNIVHVTTLSLTRASVLISQKKTPADAHLFLIKHFLLLKEQIVAFDIEFVKPDVNIDFSAVTGTFWELQQKPGGMGLFSPDGLFRLVKGAAMPRVVENMLDAKVELDVRLRAVINEFTASWSGRMTEPINGPSNRIATAGGADPAKSVRDAVERNLPVLRQKLVEYIDDLRTRETLVGAVQELVTQAYENYYEETFSNPNRPRPKTAGEESWDVEMFLNWSNDTFAVGRGILGGYDDDDDDAGQDSDRGSSRAGSV